MARTKTAKEKPARKSAPKKRTRQVIGDDRIIRLLATANPKRSGTVAHRMFALYRDRMSVGDFRKAGGRSIDLWHDCRHNFIRLEDKR